MLFCLAQIFFAAHKEEVLDCFPSKLQSLLQCCDLAEEAMFDQKRFYAVIVSCVDD